MEIYANEMLESNESDVTVHRGHVLSRVVIQLQWTLSLLLQ